jgi:hypothetical protein
MESIPMNTPSRRKLRLLIAAALVGLLVMVGIFVVRRDSPEEIEAATEAVVMEIGPPPGKVVMATMDSGETAEKFWEFETTATELVAWAEGFPNRLGCDEVDWRKRINPEGERVGVFMATCVIERDGRRFEIGIDALTYPDGVGWTETWATHLDD